MNIKIRIEELREKIRYHSMLYYDQNINEIEDFEYDKLVCELKKLEEEYPEYKTLDSPTNKVGGSIKRELRKVKHDVPVISLQDVSSKEEVFNFVSKVKDSQPNAKFVVEQKIDGLSILLRYQNGRLVEGITRGDGIEGESVYENVLEIKDIPNLIPTEASYFEVRGEVYMLDKVLKSINEKQVELGKNEFQNSRNLAAGTMRQLDSRVLRDRPLNMFIFNLEKSIGVDYSSHIESLESMKQLGFVITPDYKVCGTADEVWDAIQEIRKKRWELGYGIDGAVVKVDSFDHREEFGSTIKTPRWAIAFKYPPEEIETVVENIDIQVGRTGRLSPLAIVKPVKIGGSKVSKATLHNQDYISERDIRIGDTVIMIKAGDIIPKIERVVFEKRPDDAVKYYIPDQCPVCGHVVERDLGTSDIKCINANCPSKIIRKVEYFVSKAAMNIDGFGKQAVKALFEAGYIKNIEDIYNLHIYESELLKSGIVGREKKVTKLLENIEKSKKNNVVDLLTGLGIPNVGKESAKSIMKHFASLEDLMKTDRDTLINISDIGLITAEGILEYFLDNENRYRIIKLKEAGLNMISEVKAGSTNKLEGKTFVITGKLSIPRDEYQNMIELNGGKMSAAISTKTDYLLAGEKAGNKRTKAENLGVEIISEEEFLDLIK